MTKRMTLAAVSDKPPVEPDRVFIYGVEKVGKCFAPDTPVLFFDGSVRPASDVGVGSVLMGPDSRPRRVLERHDGFGPMYRVIPNKGEPFSCSGTHEIACRFSNTGKDRLLRADEWEGQTRCAKINFQLVRTGVEFSERPLPYDPYFLGVWLGDGTADSTTPEITKPDVEIQEYVAAFSAQHGLTMKRHGPGGMTMNLVAYSRGETPKPNPVGRFLRSIGKHIPEAYLINSRENRLLLLAGLLDTDGYYIHGCFEIAQRRADLAAQIMFLARSLGFRVTTRLKYVNGVGYTRLVISGPVQTIPTKIARKKAAPVSTRKNPMHVGFRVERIEDGPFIGFEVDDDHLFLLGDCTIVHNSTFGACAPAPVFISAERGLAELDPPPAHFPEAESFQDVLDALEELTTGQHAYQTVVIDSLDWIEQMIAVAVCARCRTKSGKPWTMEDFTAYGQGQKVAVEDWRKLFLALDRLQMAKGMEAILIAHATTKNFDDPTGIPFTRYEPQMTGNIGPKIVKQWAKSILFARFEYAVREGEGFEKAKGTATGRRVVYTQWSAAYDAGSRYELPPVLPLDYAEYAKARDAKRVASPERMIVEARGLLSEWAPTDENDRKTAETAIESAAGNATKLARILDRLRTKIAEKGN